MSSNLISNDGIIEKLLIKKLAKENEQQKKGLKSDKKNQIKLKLKKTKLSHKNWENSQDKRYIEGWNWEKQLIKNTMQNQKKKAIKKIKTGSDIKIKWN